MPKRLSLPIKLGFLFSVCLSCVLWNHPGFTAPHNLPSHKKSVDLKSFNHEFINNLFLGWKPKEPYSPEFYIDPTLRAGLDLVLPSTIQKNLKFDAGYDRWEGLPTISADYLFAIRSWSDKSLFFTPRVGLTGSRESFSVGGGVRQLITAETMVGFHAFHDWVRPRRGKGDYLKQAGVGIELSALPGRYSDLTLSANAYFPINERSVLKNNANTLVRETLPTGGDVRIGFQLPSLTNYLDIRLDGEVHSYRAEATNLTGYKAGLNVRTRDGMLSTHLETNRDSRFGQSYRVEGNISLAFDWVDLLEGKNPFSAPYKAPNMRFARQVRDSLYGRVTRKHDLPMDKMERKTTLIAQVSDNTVYLSGGFPYLANAWVTVQTSQSPWEDCMDIMTDASGGYSGRLDLPPGIYRIRLVHKASGRVSNVKTIVVEEKKSE